MSNDASFTIRFTEAGLEKVNSDLAKLVSNIGNSAAVGEVLGHVFAEAGMKAIELGAEAVKAVAEITAEFGRAIVEAASFDQRMSLAFHNLLHGSSESDAVLQNTIDLAAQLGMNVEETTDAYRSFLAAQLSPGEATALVKMTADLRAAGVAGEETQRVMYTLREINDLGTLQARQLRMLEMAGVSGKLIREELAKSLNIDEAGVEKAMSQNKIKADVAIEAIENAVKAKLGEANLGDAGQQFADNTLTGMWGKLQAAWDKGMLEIGKEVGPTLTDAFKPIFKDLMAWMQGDAGKTFIKEIVGGVRELAGAAQAAWPLMKSLLGGIGTGFKDALPAIKEMGSGLGKMLGGTDADTMQKIGKALGYMAAGAILVAEAFGAVVLTSAQLVGDFIKIEEALLSWPSVDEIVDWAKGLEDDVVGALDKLVGDAESAGANMVSGLISGIRGGIGKAVAAAKELASGVEGGIKDALGIASPSKVFAEIGLHTAAGLQEGIEGGSDGAQRAAEDMVSPGAVAAAAPSPSMFTGGSSVSTTTNHAGASVTINVNVTAPAGAQGSQQFATELAQEIRRGIAVELRAALAPS